MTITPHLLQAESPTDELAMLLVGEKKSGKSRLAATAPGNVLFLEMDRRSAALRTHPNYKNIYALEFADNLNSTQPPSAFNEMQAVINGLEKSPFLRDVNDVFKSCGDKVVDTIIFDSVQTIADSARRYIMFNNNDVAKVFTMGTKTYRVAKTFHAWGGEMEMVTGAILQARALLHCKKCWQSVTSFQGRQWHTGQYNMTAAGPVVAPNAPKYDHEVDPRAMNVIAILHECLEEDERSTEENPIYTGKIDVYPRRYNSLLVYFNEVWRLTRENGGAPVIQADPNGRFIQAASGLGVTKDAFKEPDIQAILRFAKSVNKR